MVAAIRWCAAALLTFALVAPQPVLAQTVTLNVTPSTASFGTPMTFSGTIGPFAIGVAPPTFQMDFGDGSPLQTIVDNNAVTTPFSFVHTYAASGTFVACVRENGGCVQSANATVTPAVSISGAPNPQSAGSAVTFTLSVSPISGRGVPTLTVDFGDGSAPVTVPAVSTTLSHTYAIPNTYTVTVKDSGGATVATTTERITVPPATVSSSPNPQLLNAPVAIVVTPSFGIPGTFTLLFGDGAQTTVSSAAPSTTMHAYASTGAFTITLLSGASTLATTRQSIITPGATLRTSLNPQLTNTQVTYSWTVTPLGSLPAPVSMRLALGDGTFSDVAYGNGSFNYSYTTPGLYQVTLGVGAQQFGALTESIVAQTQTLTISNPRVTIHTPVNVNITINPAAGFGAQPIFLNFGDGTPSTSITSSGVYPHSYAVAGFYNITLSTNNPPSSRVRQAILGAVQVEVDGASPRVPTGTIYSSSFTLSPVLAGGQTDVLVIYKINAPTMPFNADPIEAYLDLLDKNGKLIHRSDTFEVAAPQYSGPGTKTLKIPFLVPVDASGIYKVKIIFRSAQGGTIMESDPMTLIVIGGPDPTVSVNVNFHSTGSLEIGPHAGTPGVTFDPGMALGLLLPNSTGTLSGLFDPVSHRSDPVLTVKSGAAPSVAAPDTTPAPSAGPSPAAIATPSSMEVSPSTSTTTASQSNAVSPTASPAATPAAPAATAAPVTRADAAAVHSYTEIGGRGQGGLPAVLGGNSTLRGLDLTNQVGPMTYQAGYGYTNLATGSLSAQRGLIGDITRSFSGTGSARLTYFGRQDDPATYVTGIGATGPLAGDAEVLEFNSPQLGPLKIYATGAMSQAHGLLTDYRVYDAADRVALTWIKDKTNVSFDYHNAGELFSVGGGPSAVSDRVGFTSASQFGLGNATLFAFGYSKDEARSAFSRQSDAFGTFNFALPNSGALQLGVKRDTQVAPTADVKTDSGIMAWSGKLGIGTYSFSGNIASADDLLTGASSSTTRTLALQYALQTNAHALGIGINSTLMSGSAALASVGESLTYGFPFGGRVVGGVVVHGLELQLSGTNITNHSVGAGGTDRGANAVLAYHLSAHLAVGLRGEFTWHSDSVPANNAKASALRLRFDLTQ
jgi:hypothetical protein